MPPTVLDDDEAPRDRSGALAYEWFRARDLLYEGTAETGWVGSAVPIAVMARAIDARLEQGASDADAIAAGVAEMRRVFA